MFMIAAWIGAFIFNDIWKKEDEEFGKFLNIYGREIMDGGSAEFKGRLYSLDTPLVRYDFCTSVLIVTFTRCSSLRPVSASAANRMICILLTFFGGWWGIPWGSVHSVKALMNCASPEVTSLRKIYGSSFDGK